MIITSSQMTCAAHDHVMDEHVMSTRANEQTHALTIPRSSSTATGRGKFEFRARLVSPAHTLCGYNTEVEKNI
jgi:hypothetical protein